MGFLTFGSFCFWAQRGVRFVLFGRALDGIFSVSSAWPRYTWEVFGYVPVLAG
jgi:hypothetical protein